MKPSIIALTLLAGSVAALSVACSSPPKAHLSQECTAQSDALLKRLEAFCAEPPTYPRTSSIPGLDDMEGPLDGVVQIATVAPAPETTSDTFRIYSLTDEGLKLGSRVVDPSIAPALVVGNASVAIAPDRKASSVAQWLASLESGASVNFVVSGERRSHEALAHAQQAAIDAKVEQLRKADPTEKSAMGKALKSGITSSCPTFAAALDGIINVKPAERCGFLAKAMVQANRECSCAADQVDFNVLAELLTRKYGQYAGSLRAKIDKTSPNPIVYDDDTTWQQVAEQLNKLPTPRVLWLKPSKPSPLKPDPVKAALPSAGEAQGSFGAIAGILAGAKPVNQTPGLVLSPTSVDGACGSGTVGLTVTRRKRAFSACYQQRLRAEPKLKGGTLDLGFTIAGSGKVEAVSVRGTLEDDKVRSCVKRVVSRMRFKEPQKDTCRVRNRLTFSASK